MRSYHIGIVFCVPCWNYGIIVSKLPSLRQASNVTYYHPLRRLSLVQVL